jgi:hypothetical protein
LLQPALEKQVFDIQSEQDFEKAALAVFQFQAKHNEVYKKYINLLEVNIEAVTCIEKIPFLPIHFFKQFQEISDIILDHFWFYHHYGQQI